MFHPSSIFSATVIFTILSIVAWTDPILPQRSGSVYLFSFPADGPSMEVDPDLGARISSLKLGTNEFLYQNKNQPHWGSTFWPSPQNAWTGSTPEPLDRETYTGGIEGSTLTLTGPRDDVTQLNFVKHFSADDADTSITVTLVIKNEGNSPKQVAPWQITRVLPGGLTFFPKGPGGIRGDFASETTELEDWIWFELDEATLPRGVAKFFADGEGWMAHVDQNGVLLLEIFPDISADQEAPAEAEIEVYADPNKRYMEVEHQGGYSSISPGDSTIWTTHWYLRQLPTEIPRTAGDPALMAYLSSMVNKTTSVRSPRAPTSSVSRSPVFLRPAIVYPVLGSSPVDAAGRMQQK